MSLPATHEAPPGSAFAPLPMMKALAGIIAVWVAVLSLHLTPALFAALITYGGTRAFAQGLQRFRPELRHPQGWGLVLLLVVVGGGWRGACRARG